MGKIKEVFSSYKINITDIQEDRLYKYYEYLLDQNKVMNLTGITEFEDVIIKHFIDSAMIKRLDINFSNKEVVDIGTGAGFPGMVLAILYEDAKFTLIDSLRKRIDFLLRLKSLIGINNVECFHSRSEEFYKVHKKKFDIGVSRAVARMDKLAEFSIPLIKKNGKFIAYKGIFTDEEENLGNKKLDKYGCKITLIDRFLLTEKENNRSLVLVENVRK